MRQQSGDDEESGAPDNGAEHDYLGCNGECEHEHHPYSFRPTPGSLEWRAFYFP